MHLKRIVGSAAALVAVAVATVLYTGHPAKGSDHQDTYNLGNSVGHNTSADITDVFVFPSPSNPNNVVLAMDVSPLIPAGMGTSKFFDPTLLWQFKISHQASGVEDQVIQFTASSNASALQQIAVYGPTKPNEVATVNTLVPLTGTVNYNDASGKPLTNGVMAFAGPRADPFYFDLFAFFSFLGDRNYQTHTSQADPGTGNAFANGDTVGTAAAASPAYDQAPARAMAPSFNGFAAGTMSSAAAGAYACSTNPAQDALSDINRGFNVLSFVVEVPKTLLTNGFSSQTIHVWATASSNQTNS